VIIACVEFWLDLPSAISTPKVLSCVPGESKEFINSLENPQIRAECEVYSSLKVLLPPYTTRVDDLEAAHDQVEYGTPKALGGVRLHIEKNWKPNPTLFVGFLHLALSVVSLRSQDKPNYLLYRGGHYPEYFDRLPSPNRYVIMASNTLFTRLDDLGKMDRRGTDPRWPSFTTFLDTVFRPMYWALQSSHSKVKFEFIGGDIVQFLAQLGSRSSSLDWREGYPTSFTRAWMSNVPYVNRLREIHLT
jgi:hypothetical protein